MTNKYKTIISNLIIVIMFLSFIVFGIGIYRFGEGMHNIDLGQNIRHINALTGESFMDTASDGNLYTGKQLYFLGREMVNEGLIMIIIGIIGFSMALGYNFRQIETFK